MDSGAIVFRSRHMSLRCLPHGCLPARWRACDPRAEHVSAHHARSPLGSMPCGSFPLIHRVCVPRFHCASSDCPRRISAEQFPDLAGSRARQTARLRVSLRQVGLALGGRAGTRLSGKLAMPISGKSLLHLVLRAPLPPVDPPRVVGVDDGAWRRAIPTATLCHRAPYTVVRRLVPVSRRNVRTGRLCAVSERGRCDWWPLVAPRIV